MARTFEFVLHLVRCVTVTVSPNQNIIIILFYLRVGSIWGHKLSTHSLTVMMVSCSRLPLPEGMQQGGWRGKPDEGEWHQGHAGKLEKFLCQKKLHSNILRLYASCHYRSVVYLMLLVGKQPSILVINREQKLIQGQMIEHKCRPLIR